uniref:Uncharacterized protein n=1 Tax=Arundo donax TaxID=35708 RepID=A0A0A9AXX9_ARUDO
MCRYCPRYHRRALAHRWPRSCPGCQAGPTEPWFCP